MPLKRKRRASPSLKGLAAGETLKRSRLHGASSLWGWVGTEVMSTSTITQEHLLSTCGFSRKSPYPFCANKYALPSEERVGSVPKRHPTPAKGELEDDVIVISDDETPLCTKKQCKGNPNCLNYLGQEQWEDEGKILVEIESLGSMRGCMGQTRHGICS